MAYYEQPPSDDEKPPGCLDALLLTRAMFGILFWPLVFLCGVMIDIGIIAYLYILYPALALIPLALTIGAIWLFARWDQKRGSSL